MGEFESVCCWGERCVAASGSVRVREPSSYHCIVEFYSFFKLSHSSSVSMFPRTFCSVRHPVIERMPQPRGRLGQQRWRRGLLGPPAPATAKPATYLIPASYELTPAATSTPPPLAFTVPAGAAAAAISRKGLLAGARRAMPPKACVVRVQLPTPSPPSRSDTGGRVSYASQKLTQVALAPLATHVPAPLAWEVSAVRLARLPPIARRVATVGAAHAQLLTSSTLSHQSTIMPRPITNAR